MRSLLLTAFVVAFLLHTFAFKFSWAHIFSKKKVIIKYLRYDNCGGTFDPVRFSDVQVSTTGDGDLVVSGKFDAYTKLEPPIKAIVKMKRRILGIWTPVPFCYKDFGSCEFDDICNYGRDLTECPPLLDEHDVPCECPIEKGRYILPGAQFSTKGTRWAALIAGHYKGSIKLMHNQDQIACYNATWTLDD
ncbi:ganglioside GM2 activator-like [Neocloeon triangulifer]|uniref:ganglioside GM2 activator-like n=1 Tax=Neocloeon triangulifer TaxID=2078957 RepID=UPI00286FA107|nr:ganglioside GM2 activator-like [Neocloeon triangulifer]